MTVSVVTVVVFALFLTDKKTGTRLVFFYTLTKESKSDLLGPTFASSICLLEPFPSKLDLDLCKLAFLCLRREGGVTTVLYMDGTIILSIF